MTMKMKASLEKRQYKYIFVDAKGEPHIPVPITSGDDFGLDNTCQAMVELQTFFGKKEGVPGVQKSIQDYITDLELDITLLKQSHKADDQARLAKRRARLTKLKALQKIVNDLCNDEKLSSALMKWSYPKPIQRALADEKPQAIFAASLDPRMRDGTLGIHPKVATFSVSRGLGPEPTAHGLGADVRAMLECVKDVIMQVPNADGMRVAIGEHALKEYKKVTVDSEADLTQLKDCLARAYVQIAGRPSPGIRDKLNTLAESYGDMTRDVDYTNLMKLTANSKTATDAVDQILTGTIQADIAALVDNSPFNDIDVRGEADERDRLTKWIQAFLALVNMHCNVVSGQKLNFGQILEKDNAFGQGFITALENAIKSKTGIANAVIQFINMYHPRFGLKEPLSAERIDKIKKDFHQKYHGHGHGTGLKDARHLDEILFFVPEIRTGDFYVHGYKIGLHLSRFVREMGSPHAAFFTGKNPVLASQVVDEKSAEPRRLPSENVLEPDHAYEIDFDTLLQPGQPHSSEVLTRLLSQDVQDEKSPGQKKFFTLIAPGLRDRIKASSYWPEVSKGVLKRLSSGAMKEFSKTWGVVGFAFHVSFDMEQAFYTKASSDRGATSLLGFSGPEKLRSALKMYEIKGDFSVDPNEAGGYTVTFSDPGDIERVQKLYEQAKEFMHLSRSILKTLYLEATRIKGSDLKHEGTIGKAKESLEILGIREEEHYQSLNYAGHDGCIMQSTDPNAFQQIRDLHRRRFVTLPAYQLTNEEVRAICKAAYIEVKSDEELPQALARAVAYPSVNPWEDHGALDILVAAIDVLPAARGGGIRVVVEEDRNLPSKWQNGITKLLKRCPHAKPINHPYFDQAAASPEAIAAQEEREARERAALDAQMAQFMAAMPGSVAAAAAPGLEIKGPGVHAAVSAGPAVAAVPSADQLSGGDINSLMATFVSATFGAQGAAASPVPAAVSGVAAEAPAVSPAPAAVGVDAAEQERRRLAAEAEVRRQYDLRLAEEKRAAAAAAVAARDKTIQQSLAAIAARADAARVMLDNASTPHKKKPSALKKFMSILLAVGSFVAGFAAISATGGASLLLLAPVGQFFLGHSINMMRPGKGHAVIGIVIPTLIAIAMVGLAAFIIFSGGTGLAALGFVSLVDVSAGAQAAITGVAGLFASYGGLRLGKGFSTTTESKGFTLILTALAVGIGTYVGIVSGVLPAMVAISLVTAAVMSIYVFCFKKPPAPSHSSVMGNEDDNENARDAVAVDATQAAALRAQLSATQALSDPASVVAPVVGHSPAAQPVLIATA